MTKLLPPDQFPPWYDGQSINEAAFCREFLTSHKLLYTENSFFTPEGRMTDVAPLKTEIYQIIEPYASTSVPKKISNIIELLKITAHIDDFPPRTDRIHVANGTLFLDGSFSTAKDRIVRSRFSGGLQSLSLYPARKRGWAFFMAFCIRLTPEGNVGSQELYEIYTVWCRENGFSPLKNQSFSEFLIANQKKYSIEHSNNLTNLVGRRVWGFTGIEPVLRLPLRTADGWQRDCSDDNPFI